LVGSFYNFRSSSLKQYNRNFLTAYPLTAHRHRFAKIYVERGAMESVHFTHRSLIITSRCLIFWGLGACFPHGNSWFDTGNK
jgi:hypothetical protein